MVKLPMQNHWLKYGRTRNLKVKYGLTLSEYENLVAKQQGRCAICNIKPLVTIKKPNPLYIDHDHKRAVVRGLLCHLCNVLIGMAKEDTCTLRNAAEYLEKTMSIATTIPVVNVQRRSRVVSRNSPLFLANNP